MSDCIRFPRLKAEPCDVEGSFVPKVSDWADVRSCCARSTLPGMTSTSIPCEQPFAKISVRSSGPIILRVLLTLSMTWIFARVWLRV